MWQALPLLAIFIYIIAFAPERAGSDDTTTESVAAEEQASLAMFDETTFAEFDPNTADYRTLVEAGVPRDIAVGIIRWRESGKVYRIKEDLALLYDMTDSLYFALEPYINIGEEFRPVKHEYTQPTKSKEQRDERREITTEPYSIYSRYGGYAIST